MEQACTTTWRERLEATARQPAESPGGTGAAHRRIRHHPWFEVLHTPGPRGCHDCRREREGTRGTLRSAPRRDGCARELEDCAMANWREECVVRVLDHLHPRPGRVWRFASRADEGVVVWSVFRTDDGPFLVLSAARGQRDAARARNARRDDEHGRRGPPRHGWALRRGRMGHPEHHRSLALCLHRHRVLGG